MPTVRNARELSRMVKAKDVGRWRVDKGLYLHIPTSGTPTYFCRYTIHGKRREISLPAFSDVSREDAVLMAGEVRKSVRGGTDPLAERNRIEQARIRTVDELYSDWQAGNEKRLLHPEIPKRIYGNEVQPYLGCLALSQVKPLDVRGVIQKVNDSGRPTVANDALMYMKQLFRHGIKLGLLDQNPADAFVDEDAGGLEKPRDRKLSKEELSSVFHVFRENISSFGRDNYLSVALLLLFANRKNELLQARWSEMDLETGIWKLTKARTKTDADLDIPLPWQAVEWLEELRWRSLGSEYVFPARRKSNKPHVGQDTLNSAINSLFGRVKRKGKPTGPNLMGDIQHFTVHDLRRTSRSLLSGLKIPPHIAERCLNHKIKGVEGVYDRYDYFQERQDALQKLADLIEPIVNNTPNVVPISIQRNKRMRSN